MTAGLFFCPGNLKVEMGIEKDQITLGYLLPMTKTAQKISRFSGPVPTAFKFGICLTILVRFALS